MTPTNLEATGIIFAPNGVKSLGEELQDKIETSLNYERLALCETINSLGYFLLPKRSKNASKKIIIVLFITNTKDMQDVLDFQDILSRFSLITILYDNYEGLINIANTMNPCVTTFIEHLRKDISPVADSFINLRNTL